MAGWHNRLNVHEFEQIDDGNGDGKWQGSLLCCSLWGRKESDTTKQPNSNSKFFFHFYHFFPIGVVFQATLL